MNALRSGETLEEEKDTYDISKDLLAHAKGIKSFNASARGKEDEVSVEELKELRRVQKERTEVSVLYCVYSSFVPYSTPIPTSPTSRSLPTTDPKNESPRNGHPTQHGRTNGESTSC